MLNDEIRTIMTHNPEIAHPSDNLSDLTEKMITHGLQQLPVVEDGKLLGMVTTYDLWKDARATGTNDQRKVSDIMSTSVIKLAPKDKLGTAAELFMDKRFKTLPVVNLDNDLKGIVTAFDVIRTVMKKEYPTPILYEKEINGTY